MLLSPSRAELHESGAALARLTRASRLTTGAASLCSVCSYGSRQRSHSRPTAASASTRPSARSLAAEPSTAARAHRPCSARRQGRRDAHRASIPWNPRASLRRSPAQHLSLPATPPTKPARTSRAHHHLTAFGSSLDRTPRQCPTKLRRHSRAHLQQMLTSRLGPQLRRWSGPCPPSRDHHLRRSRSRRSRQGRPDWCVERACPRSGSTAHGRHIARVR